jgi:hypothetical protein
MIELIHRLHGSAEAEPEATRDGEGDGDGDGDIEVRIEGGGRIRIAAPIAAWHAPGNAITIDDVRAEWQRLAAEHGVRGGCSILTTTARARTFIVEPGREVIVAVPRALASPAERFAALHELGHAVAALLAPAPLPRAFDEAAAAWIARRMESPSHPWWSPDAAAARARRGQLARALAAIERGTARDPSALAPAPPWALWHDPYAQAAYLAAEAIAARHASLGALLATRVA